MSGHNPILLSGLLAVALVACSNTTAPPDTDDESRTPVATSSSLPSPSISAETGGSESAEVESAYRAFWPVLATFARGPESRWRTVLDDVAMDPQLGLTIALTREQRRNGTTVYGQPRPRAPRFLLASDGQATVDDCADFSGTGQVDRRSGQRKTVGVPRNPVRVSLRKSMDGRWRVSEISYPGGRC